MKRKHGENEKIQLAKKAAENHAGSVAKSASGSGESNRSDVKKCISGLLTDDRRHAESGEISEIFSMKAAVISGGVSEIVSNRRKNIRKTEMAVALLWLSAGMDLGSASSCVAPAGVSQRGLYPCQLNGWLSAMAMWPQWRNGCLASWLAVAQPSSPASVAGSAIWDQSG